MEMRVPLATNRWYDSEWYSLPASKKTMSLKEGMLVRISVHPNSEFDPVPYRFMNYHRNLVNSTTEKIYHDDDPGHRSRRSPPRVFRTWAPTLIGKLVSTANLDKIRPRPGHASLQDQANLKVSPELVIELVGGEHVYLSVNPMYLTGQCPYTGEVRTMINPDVQPLFCAEDIDFLTQEEYDNLEAEINTETSFKKLTGKQSTLADRIYLRETYRKLRETRPGASGGFIKATPPEDSKNAQDRT